jgi:chemotaxis protein MotA
MKKIAIQFWKVIGLPVAGTVLFAALLSYGSFLNLEGLVIVIGGCIVNACLSYQRQDVLKAFETIRGMLSKAQTTVHHLHLDIMQLIMWSYIVQQKDLVGLEKESARKAHDPMMRYGLDLVLSSYDAQSIRQMMHNAADTEFERRCMPVTVLRNMANTAPAFGMVGTLAGMVVLLKSAGTDLAGIESGLGVAMLSTLYGILAARLICLPAADNLLLKEEKRHFRYYMIAEGLAMIAEKRRPLYMQDRLNSFLEPARHMDLSDHVHAIMSRRVAAAA